MPHMSDNMTLEQKLQIQPGSSVDPMAVDTDFSG